MISVVCVFNNEKTLKDVLLKGLETQTVQFELITLDNRANRYKSASEALNHGGEKAKGDYIVFAHQDMWLGSKTWLEDVEVILKNIPDLGVAGVAGLTKKGRDWEERHRWSIEDFGELWGGTPVKNPEEVQTLDECLLIVPRPVFVKLRFDEKNFDGWDCYGADYCLSVAQLGLKAYVIPGSCGHSCARRKGYQLWEYNALLKYQKVLYKKHKKNHGHIHTWMGEVSWLNLRVRELMQFLGPAYLRLFPAPYNILRKELAGCETVLDLGCGHHSPIHRFDILFSVGVELFKPNLEESKRKGTHSQYIQADLKRIEFKQKSFDAVIAIEVLEHLNKQEGAELIGKMVQWAKRKVIITTPNGYLRQDPCICANNPLQERKSGWSVQELTKLGFKVYGINGWKSLRGPKGLIRFRHIILWSLISNLTQKITYYCPKLAFQLLAVKHVKEANTK